MRVGVMSAVRRIHYGEDGCLAEERGSESQGGIKREGSCVLQAGDGRDVKASGKGRRQSKAGKFLGEDGRGEWSRAGQQGKADSSSSKLTGVGRKQQSRRKGKGKGD